MPAVTKLGDGGVARTSSIAVKSIGSKAALIVGWETLDERGVTTSGDSIHVFSSNMLETNDSFMPLLI